MEEEEAEVATYEELAQLERESQEVDEQISMPSIPSHIV